MAQIQQLLSSPVRYPVHNAAEWQKGLFSDILGAQRNGYFYHFSLASGLEFVGYFNTREREALFRPINHVEELKNLKEIRYFSKYYYHRPELMCQVVLSDACPADEKAIYHAIFDSQSKNLSDPDGIYFKNHALGQAAQKMFTPLQDIEYAAQKSLQGKAALNTVLNGLANVKQLNNEGR